MVASSVTGGAATRVDSNQVVTAQTPGWDSQYAIWSTPWGFLKGAAKARPTLRSETLQGRVYRVVSWTTTQTAPSGKPYRLEGYIGPTNLVERVVTWDANPVLGDMMVDSRYSDYRDLNGLKFPTTTVQSVGGHPFFTLQTLGVQANPKDLAKLLASPAAAPRPPAPPASTASASDKLADGVWRIRGAYNALAVEFKDQVVLFEPGPQNEARAQAIIAETRRLVPSKPIRFGVISHHHFDHTGGLQAVAAEGITIVTPQVNKAFLDKALSAPRTLAPDALARSGRKPVIEGFAGDKRVFTDGVRTLEIHVIKGLPHADGMVMAWLPAEKILVYADMFNLPSADKPIPDPPVVGTRVFVENLDRLKIEPERIMSVHSLNPDRLTTLKEIRASMGD